MDNPNQGTIIDYGLIPKETMDWLDEIGEKKCESPMVYYAPPTELSRECMPYSFDYLVNTPLEEIKRGRERHECLFSTQKG